MVGEDLIYAIPPELLGKFSWLLITLQAVGWVIVIYIVFSIVNAILHRKRLSEMKLINTNLEEIKVLLRRNLQRK